MSTCLPFYRLNWELDGFQENLTESKQILREMIADSDLLIVTPSYGKRIPKKCNLSPDGWFQVCMDTHLLTQDTLA